jgi:hypothetical protein
MLDAAITPRNAKRSAISPSSDHDRKCSITIRAVQIITLTVMQWGSLPQDKICSGPGHKMYVFDRALEEPKQVLMSSSSPSRPDRILGHKVGCDSGF